VNQLSLSADEADRATSAINDGPWTPEQRSVLTVAVSSVFTGKREKDKYKAQKLDNLIVFFSAARYKKVSDPNVQLEMSLDLIAQQFVDIECYVPSEKSYGAALQDMLELKGQTMNFNAQQKLDKIKVIKEAVRYYRGKA
jgi:hypothetical protein